jgi:hypothetical protein
MALLETLNSQLPGNFLAKAGVKGKEPMKIKF